MNRTIHLDERVTLNLKPALRVDEDLRLSLKPLTACGVTLPGGFTVACSVRGERVTAFAPTLRDDAGQVCSPRPGTLIQKALRAGADVFILRGTFQNAAFTVTEVDLHVQPGKVEATREHAERRSEALLARLTHLARGTLAELLPEAGTPVTLEDGRVVTAHHVTGGGLLVDHAAVLLRATQIGGDPDVGGYIQGGFDAHRAPDFAQALSLNRAFEGRDTDADEADARVTYDPETAEVRLEVYGEGLDVEVSEHDRLAVARAVLGAFTCPAMQSGEDQAHAAV